MKKIFYLATCNTCHRIIKELKPAEDVEFQELKSEPITEAQLDEMARMAGSYEVLFNRRARKYRSEGLADQKLNEGDYRRLILDEYTFLKRPMIIVEDQIFVGNSKKTVQAAKQALD